MNIQFDLKSILVVFFLVISLFFGYKWYFSIGDRKDYKDKIEQLEIDNKKLRETRDSLQTAFLDLQKQYDDIVLADSLLNQEIIDLRQKVIDSKNKADRSVRELNRLKIELEKINQKIKELENNPPSKTEEELIESLKNKIK